MGLFFRTKLTVALATLCVFGAVNISSAQQKDDKGKLVGNALLNEKCSKCHGTDRPLGKTKTKEEWETTVKRMQSKDPSWISDDNAKEIIWFLASKSLFDTKCSKCHGTDRPLGKTKNKNGWSETIKRMQGKDPSWISDDNAQQIIDYLFTVKGE